MSISGGVYSGSVTASGTLTFVVDGVAASPALPLVSGSVTYTYPDFQTAGQHTLVAMYSGDALVTAGSSRSTNVSVSAATQSQNSTVTITASSVTPAFGTPVTLSVAVKSSSASSTTTPTGFVTSNIDGLILPTVALDASGRASVSYTYTMYGSSNITASYSGDNFYYSNNNSLTLSVPFPPAPTIALTLSPAAVTLLSNGVATVGLTVNSVNSFSGPVEFAATILSGSGAAFSSCYVVLPSVVNASRSSPGTATLSMALAGSSVCAKANVVRMAMAASSAKESLKGRVPWVAVVAAGVFCCTMLKRRTSPGLLVLAFALYMAGCGGGGGVSTTSGTTTTPTTAVPTGGTYMVRVTATAQTTGVSSSGTFNLTVQ